MCHGIRRRSPADPDLTHSLHKLQENKFVFIHPSASRNDCRVTFDIDITENLQITLFGTILDLNAIGLNIHASLPVVEQTLLRVRLCYGKICSEDDNDDKGELWEIGQETFRSKPV